MPNLSAHERARYAAWYQTRTGAERAITTKEPVFVVAAFLTASVGGDAPELLNEFARRFRERAVAADLTRAVLAALAVNRLGLSAAAALFGDALDTWSDSSRKR